MNKENCALKLVDEIILYYDARSIKHQIKRRDEFMLRWEMNLITFSQAYFYKMYLYTL